MPNYNPRDLIANARAFAISADRVGHVELIYIYMYIYIYIYIYDYIYL